MQIGPISRTRTSQRKYDEHKKRKDPKIECEFCVFTANKPPVTGETPLFWIVQNRFGYDIWDGCQVLEHLMLVPKRHVHSLSELTKKERTEYAQNVCKYEGKGYSLYSRAPDNITKSVPHQHTHLIKLAPKRISSQIYLRKPHFLYFK